MKIQIFEFFFSSAFQFFVFRRNLGSGPRADFFFFGVFIRGISGFRGSGYLQLVGRFASHGPFLLCFLVAITREEVRLLSPSFLDRHRHRQSGLDSRTTKARAYRVLESHVHLLKNNHSPPPSERLFRSGQSTVGGPKWTKMAFSGQNGPSWSCEC